MPRPRPHRASERGAALLIAVVSVAVLTALAVDLAYETQVRLRAAANARDALRAEALAESGVTMARLVISMQQGIDQMMKAVGQAQGALAGAPTAAIPRPQVWNLVPVETGLVQALFGDAGAAEARPAAAGAAEAAMSTARFGDFDGGFDARLEDEAQKIDLQLSDLLTSAAVKPQAEALLRLMCDAKWDPLFNRTDADGQRYSRTDLLVHLRDWADDDANASALVASFPGGNCSFEVGQPPFEKSFADENMPYDRGKDRYKAKNARLDSLEELHLVAGVSDAFLAAFGDQFTVYLPQGGKRNINTLDPKRLQSNAFEMAEPASYATVLDPGFMEKLRKLLLDQTMGGFFAVSLAQFTGALEQLGVSIKSVYRTPGPNNPYADSTLVYRIRSSGVAGDVSQTIDAVVSYDEKILPPEDVLKQGQTGNMNPRLGALIRWREE